MIYLFCVNQVYHYYKSLIDAYKTTIDNIITDKIEIIHNFDFPEHINDKITIINFSPEIVQSVPDEILNNLKKKNKVINIIFNIHKLKSFEKIDILKRAFTDPHTDYIIDYSHLNMEYYKSLSIPDDKLIYLRLGYSPAFICTSCPNKVDDN